MKRADVFLTTKVWIDNVAPDRFMASVDESLAKPDVVALSKTVTESRAEENAAIFDFSFDEAEMAAIHAPAVPDGRVLKPEVLSPPWDAA